VVGAENAALPEDKLVTEDAVRSHAWIFDALDELVAATTRRSSSTVASRRGIWA